MLYLVELPGQQVFNRIFKRGSCVCICVFVFHDLHIHCNHRIVCVHCKMQKDAKGVVGFGCTLACNMQKLLM